MSSALPFVQPAGHGIHVVDTGFHRPLFDAAYLIVEAGRAAFVDTGTNHSVPRLLAALDAAEVPRDAVDYVIATHVHLDHAGGVGRLMQALPRATLVVHPRGARHLIDPKALVDGARAVYGDDEVARSYGDVIGVPAERVRETADGMTLELNGRPLHVIDTPGHARHHHCLWDETSRGWFTGDTFGLSYREFDTDRGAWAMPTTTPVQFEPGPLRASIERLLSRKPDCMYVTHYGRVDEPARLGALLLDQLDAMVALAESVAASAAAWTSASAPPDRHAALKNGLRGIAHASLARHGCTLAEGRIDDLLAIDFELNAQGIGVWLDRRKT